MSKKATGMWRCILGVLSIIVLCVGMIIGLTSCEIVETDNNHQETNVDETESKTESETESKTEFVSDSESESKTETENNEIQKAVGLISEMYIPTEESPYYLFRIRGDNNWYKFFVNEDSIELDVLKVVSIEYVEADEEGNYIIQKIQLLEPEEEENAKVEGIIREITRKPVKDSPYYFFRLEGSDNLYSYFCTDMSLLSVGNKISIEYEQSAVSGIYDVKELHFIQ